MSEYEQFQQSIVARMVDVARRAAHSPAKARTDRDAMIEREYRMKAWSELIRWKTQVPELVPESMEELQEGLNRA